MSRTQLALKTTATSSFFNYVGSILSLITVPLFLKWLGKADYGLMLTVLSLNGFLSMGNHTILGGSRILIAIANGRIKDKEAEISKIFRHGISLSVISVLFIGFIVGIYFFSAKAGYRLEMIDSVKADWLVLILGMQLIIGLIGGNFSNLFRAMQHGYWTGFYNGMGRIFGVLIMIYVAWYTKNVIYVMLASSIGVLFTAIATGIHSFKRYNFVYKMGSFFDIDQIKNQLTAGSKNLAFNIGNTIKENGPVWVIAGTIGNAFVPVFTVTKTLFDLVMKVGMGYNSSLQSAYGEAFTSGDHFWLRNKIRENFKINLLICIVSLFILIPIANKFISWWTSGALNPDLSTVAFIGLFVSSTYFLKSFMFILNGLNRQRKGVLIYITDGIFSTGIGLLVILKFGLMGLLVEFFLISLFFTIPLLIREIRLETNDAEIYPIKDYWLKFIFTSMIFFIFAAISVMIFKTIPQNYNLLIVFVYSISSLLLIYYTIGKLRLINYSYNLPIVNKTIYF